MKYWKYLRYVMRHKWYVFVESCKVGIPFRGLVHDWSKFLPGEFIPYARYFYGDISKGRDETGYYKPADSGYEPFDLAWLYHQHRNPHHWQYWCLAQDEEDDKTVRMPEKYVLEMLCDWRGAGKAQGYGDNTQAWYEKNKGKMKFHPETRKRVEELVDEDTA
jgi:hypothetical protein